MHLVCFGKKAAVTVVASTGRLIVTEERWSRRPRGKVITYIEDNTKKQEVITNTGDNIEMIQKKTKKTGGARGQGAKLSHIEGIIKKTEGYFTYSRKYNFFYHTQGMI